MKEKVIIICPTCKKSGSFEKKRIDEILSDNNKELKTISIYPKTICEHHFQAFIDKDYAVRGYQKTDGSVKQATEEAKDENKIDLNFLNSLIDVKTINLDQIKMIIPEIELRHILKSIFVKKKIILILESYEDFIDFEDPYLKDEIFKFFNYVTCGNFDYKLKLISIKQFQKNINTYYDYIVLSNDEIINDSEKILSESNLTIVKDIVKKIYKEQNNVDAIKRLKKELDNTYKMALMLKKILSNCKTKKVFLEDVSKDFENELKKNAEDESKSGNKSNLSVPKEIPKEIIILLICIVEYYFKTKIPKIKNLYY